MEEINKLKKEISTLQGIIDAYKMSENEANEIIAELKAGNKRLKEEIRRYKSEHKYSNAEFRQERESIVQLSYYKNKYKRALREIKEIAEFHTTQADSEDVQEDMKQILQKIAQASRVRSVGVGLREQDEQDTETRLMRVQQDAECEVNE